MSSLLLNRTGCCRIKTVHSSWKGASLAMSRHKQWMLSSDLEMSSGVFSQCASRLLVPSVKCWRLQFSCLCQRLGRGGGVSVSFPVCSMGILLLLYHLHIDKSWGDSKLVNRAGTKPSNTQGGGPHFMNAFLPYIGKRRHCSLPLFLSSTLPLPFPVLGMEKE